MPSENSYTDRGTLVSFLRKRIALILVVCMCVAAIGLISAEIVRMKRDAIHMAKSETRYYVERAIEFINNSRKYGRQQRYRQLENRLEMAYSAISYQHQHHIGNPEQTIRQELLETLSSLRSSQNNIEYFVIDADGKVLLGRNYTNNNDINQSDAPAAISENTITQMIRAINVSNDGHFYYEDEGENPRPDSLTHAYIKKYEPLGWIIGTSMSMSRHRKETQDYVRQRLSDISFAENSGYIFVKSFEGVELVNRTQPQLVGQNIWQATDPNGVQVVQEIIKKSRQKNGGFVDYTWNNPTTGKPGLKTSYARSIEDWGWAVGTGFYHDDIDKILASQQDTLERHMIGHVLLMSFIGAIALIWAWWIWKKTSGNLNKELSTFSEYFSQTERDSDILDIDQFKHTEFADLAGAINRMAERQQEDESFRQALLDNLQVGVVVIDPETHTIEMANPVAAKMFSSQDVEFTGQSCRHLCMSKTGQCPMTGMEGHTRTKQGQLVRADGTPIPILKSVSWVRMGGKKRLLESFVDMTNRVKVEKQLEQTALRAEQLAAEAEKATKAKSEFLSNMSHEIRTPMNGIIGMTELLKDSCKNSDQKQYVDMIQSCSEQLLSLINCILDFSKIEAGHFELEMLDFDLLEAVESVTDILAIKAAEKNLEFSCFVSPDIPTTLCGDPGRLRQILINLAGNAIKFTHDGEVAISATLQKETETHVTLNFDVRDTGIGIPADKIGKLFKVFSQVDSSTARKYGGTGLGLAISKQLVEMMDGEIDVNSIEGEGTCFNFTVQLQKQNIAKIETNAATEDLSGQHILIVDDNATNRQILEKYLSSWNIRSQQADCGERALTKLQQAVEANDPISIVITDQHMPGMDGLSLGRSVKANPILKNTTMVMLSSAGHIKDYENLKKTGFAAQMLKPVRRQLLLSCIRDIHNGNVVESQQANADQTQDSSKQARDIKVLLVEDNPANQVVGKRLIEKILTIKPDIANNGREAITKLTKKHYDIVFMDCQMPEMDGFEATKIVRMGKTLNTTVPIVAMTANAMKGDREKCLEVGMDDYISKPVSYESISEAIQRQLNICTAT